MGLDSVELIMSFEKYFDVSIPDPVAERIWTIDDTVEVISGLVQFSEAGDDKKTEVVAQLSNLITALGFSNRLLEPVDKIYAIVPLSNEAVWRHIAGQMDLELPHPYPMTRPGLLFKKILSYKVDEELVTVDRFIDLVCSVNYKRLLDRKNIRDRYEVLVAVMGITIEQCGLNPYEVSPEKSYVDDLGIE